MGRPNTQRTYCKSSTQASLRSCVTGRLSYRENYKSISTSRIYRPHHRLFYFSEPQDPANPQFVADPLKACTTIKALYTLTVLGCRNTFYSHNLNVDQDIDTPEKCAFSQQLPFSRSLYSTRVNMIFDTSTTVQST